MPTKNLFDLLNYGCHIDSKSIISAVSGASVDNYLLLCNSGFNPYVKLGNLNLLELSIYKLNIELIEYLLKIGFSLSNDDGRSFLNNKSMMKIKPFLSQHKKRQQVDVISKLISNNGL